MDILEMIPPRQTEIFMLAADGLSNKQIASAMSITSNSVKTLLNRAYYDLGVRCRAAAIEKWIGQNPPKPEPKAAPQPKRVAWDDRRAAILARVDCVTHRYCNTPPGYTQEPLFPLDAVAGRG